MTIVAIGLGLWILGKVFATDILKQLVKRETNGYYQLNFEELDLSLFQKRITVNDLVLSPDSTKNFSELGLTKVYEIELGQLLIDFESILGFYFDKELDINNVSIVDPYINMVKLDSRKSAKFSMQAGDLYQVISKYLEVLKIDYFHIEDGALQYSHNDFSLGNIDFEVKNLLMDSTGGNNNVFFSEAIELEIRNQKFNLPDGIHTLTFESFLLSTKDSVLTFKNFQLIPLPESGVTFEGNNDVNVYHIKVPELSLRGIDYVAAYQQNKLRVEELYMKEPTVFIDDESHGSQVTKEGDNSIMALIFKIFNSLEVGELVVDQAHVDLKVNGNQNYERFKAKETNLKFFEIQIDSSNYQFHSRHQYFDDLVLDIHNYRYYLPDSVHVADFDLLTLNSIKKNLLLHNLKISPKLAHKSNFSTTEMWVPALSIHGIDYRKAMVENQFVADTLSLAITLLRSKNGKHQRRKAPADFQGIHGMISPYFESVEVSSLLLRGRKLDPSASVHLGAIDINALGLKLNANTKSWTELIGGIDVDLKDFKLNQDSVKVTGGGMRGSLTGFQLADWRLDVNTQKQKIKGSVDTLMIDEVMIDSMISGKLNYFTRVELIRPILEFDIQSGDSSRKFEDHIEKEILIVDASLKGVYDDWSISIDNLSTDIFEGDNTAFRSLYSRNIDLKNPQLNHRIRLSRWNYDTLGGEMDFHDIRVEPIKKDSLKSWVDASVPFVGLKDFEQSKFFDHNKLIVSELKVKKPILNMNLTPQPPEETANSDSTFRVSIEEIILDTADLHLAGLSAEVKKLEVSSISMRLDEFDFPGELIGEEKFLFSADAKITIDAIGTQLSSDLQTSISGVSFHSYNGALRIDSIHLSSKEEKVMGVFRQTEISGLDMWALKEHGAVKMDTIKVKKICGENRIGDSAKNQGSFYYDKSLSIETVDLPEIQWKIVSVDREKPFVINDGYLQVAGISSKGALTMENLPDRIERFQFGGRDFGIDLDDGYRVDISHYEVNHPDHAIALEGVELKSKYDKEAFSKTLESQNDYFDVTVDQIGLYPSEISEMMAGENFQFKRVDLAGLDALIYRDKAVPPNNEQVRALPQADLRNIKIPLQIDLTHVTGNLVYQEKIETAEEAGEISFNCLDLHLLNLSSRTSGEEVMRLKALGSLMDVGEFKVDALFDLNHPYDRFALSGSVTDFPLDSLNRLLVPVANVRINKGLAKELNFNFVANDTLAQGEMRFRYDDLKVLILNAKTHEKGGLGLGIKSFFANTFVVKHRNPTFLFLRKGTIFNHRDSTKAIFNYWAKALLSGSVSSIGIHKSDKAEKKFERNLDGKKEEE